MENKNFNKLKEAGENLIGILGKTMTMDVIYELDPDALEMLKNSMDLYKAAFNVYEEELSDRKEILRRLERIESKLGE